MQAEISCLQNANQFLMVLKRVIQGVCNRERIQRKKIGQVEERVTRLETLWTKYQQEKEREEEKNTTVERDGKVVRNMNKEKWCAGEERNTIQAHLRTAEERQQNHILSHHVVAHTVDEEQHHAIGKSLHLQQPHRVEDSGAHDHAHVGADQVIKEGPAALSNACKETTIRGGRHVNSGKRRRAVFKGMRQWEIKNTLKQTHRAELDASHHDDNATGGQRHAELRLGVAPGSGERRRERDKQVQMGKRRKTAFKALNQGEMEISIRQPDRIESSEPEDNHDVGQQKRTTEMPLGDSAGKEESRRQTDRQVQAGKRRRTTLKSHQDGDVSDTIDKKVRNNVGRQQRLASVQKGSSVNASSSWGHQQSHVPSLFSRGKPRHARQHATSSKDSPITPVSRTRLDNGMNISVKQDVQPRRLYSALNGKHNTEEIEKKTTARKPEEEQAQIDTPPSPELPSLPTAEQVVKKMRDRDRERREQKRSKPLPCPKCRLRKRALMLREKGYVNEEVFERWASKPGNCLYGVHQDEPPQHEDSGFTFKETETQRPREVEG